MRITLLPRSSIPQLLSRPYAVKNRITTYLVPSLHSIQPRFSSSSFVHQLRPFKGAGGQLNTTAIMASSGSTSSAVPEAKITKVSANIIRHDYYPDDEKHPTLLLLSWLKATPRALDHFRHIYAAKGFNVVTVTSKPFHFIWPKSSVPLAEEICSYIITQTQGPVIVHALSIGGFIYSSCLLHALKHQDVFDALDKRIQGQVFDSLVAGELDQMAEGVSKGSAGYPTTRYLVHKSIMMYFRLAKQHTVSHYDRAVEVFKNVPFKTPILLYYSKIDTMCSNEVMESMVETWRDKYSLDVNVKIFEDSQHVFHLRKHPEEYKQELEKFIDKLIYSHQRTELNSML